MKKLFDRIDTDGSGTVDADEIAAVLKVATCTSFVCDVMMDGLIYRETIGHDGNTMMVPGEGSARGRHRANEAQECGSRVRIRASN